MSRLATLLRPSRLAQVVPVTVLPVTVLAGIAIVVCLSSPAAAQQPPAPAVTVAKPVVKDIVEWDEFIGRFEAVDQVDIRARVSGYVDKIAFRRRRDWSRSATCSSRSTSAPTRRRSTRREASARSRRKARARFRDRAISSAPSRCARPATSPSQVFDQRRAVRRDRQGRRQPGAGGAATGAKLDLEFTEIRAPIAGRMSRRAGLGRQPRQRQRHGARPTSSRSTRSTSTSTSTSAPTSPMRASRPGALRTSSDGDANEVAGRDRRRARADAARARSTSSTTGSTRPAARCAAAPVLENKDACARRPACSAASASSARDPYKGVLVPDEAIGTDQDRRIVYVVGDDDKRDAAGPCASARASTATASSARA